MRVQKIMFDCLESLIRCTPQSGDSTSSIVVSKQAQETLSRNDSERDQMIEESLLGNFAYLDIVQTRVYNVRV